METKFKDIKNGARFRKGKRTFRKAPFPFGGNQMGGVYGKGSWRSFEDDDTVEKLDPVINDA